LWVLIALASIILLIVIILSLPIDIIFSFNTQKSPHLSLHLKLLYGLFRVNLRGDRGKQDPRQEQKKTSQKPDKRFNPNVIVGILGIRGILRQVYILIRDLLRSSKIKTLDLNLKVGLEDPVDNGYLFTFIAPVNYLLARTPYDITLQTVFENELVLECDIYSKIRSFPILIAGGLLRFVFSSPGYQTVKLFMDREWQRKR
jgi:hypothetical protein